MDDKSKTYSAAASVAPPMASGAQWYIHVAPDNYGPFSIQHMRELVSETRLTAESLVWTPGAAQWSEAINYPVLKGLFAGAAPPKPPVPAPASPAVAPRPSASAQAVDPGAARSRFTSIASQLTVSTAAPGAAARDEARPEAVGVTGAANSTPVNFEGAVRRCLQQKYATFQGRAPRSELWWFMLFVTLVTGVLFTLATTLALLTSSDGSMSMFGLILIFIASLAPLGLLVPMIAVSVRRLHDLGWSGWWYLAQLIPIVGGLASLAMFIGFMLPGVEGENKYGESPLSGARVTD